MAAFYHQVEPWLSRANQAASNPEYEPDLHLPAELPHRVEPCPRAHLAAMMAAVRSIRGRAEIAVGSYATGEVPEQHRRQFGVLRQRIADADTAADYAVGLWTGNPSQELHEKIESHIEAALEGYYLAGHMLALPELVPAGLPSPPPVRPVGAASPLAAPGSRGFDPWCLTDPGTRKQWQQDPRAGKAIDDLWRWDPEPRTTLEMQAEIDSAVARGAIERTGMHYYCCPWSAIYVVKWPIAIGGQRLRQLQQFTLDVTAEEMGEGGQFKREVVVANFEPTHRIDCCDPAAGGHHDDD